MNLDWNWFFSTLSQSTAAIVGVVAAFIIAKIFANQSVFAEKKSRIKSLLIESQRLRDKIGTIKFGWYNEVMNDRAYRSAATQIDGLESENIDSYTEDDVKAIYKEAGFSVFTEKDPILQKIRDEIISHCEFLKQRRIKREEEEAEKQRQKENPNSRFTLSAFVQSFNPQITYRDSLFEFSNQTIIPWKELDKERDAVTQCHLEAKHLARTIGDFLDSIKGNPESPKQITFSLLFVSFIFLSGVIYPLTFMPSGTPPTHAASWTDLFWALLTVKGGLLGLLTAAFLTIIGMFVGTNMAMTYDKKDIQALEELSTANNYCESFKYLDE